jgi:hypothetical protein
MLILQIYE